MPVLTEWTLDIDVDKTLRAQGADPMVVRERRPKLVTATEQALEKGTPLLQPAAIYQRFEVDSLRHEKLTLSHGGMLSGALIGQHLGGAEQIVALVCTIGNDLETHAAQMMTTDPLAGFALDAVGSAAAEALATAVCNHFEAEARALQVSIPLSPGMIGWPVKDGQPQIFDLLDTDAIGVSLTDGGMMRPRKSLSMVLGIGHEIDQDGIPCDYCTMHDTCRYQDHYPVA